MEFPIKYWNDCFLGDVHWIRYQRIDLLDTPLKMKILNPRMKAWFRWFSFSSRRNSQVPALSFPGFLEGKIMWWSKEFSSKRCHHFGNPARWLSLQGFFSKNAMIYLAKLTDRNWSHKNSRIHVVGIPGNNNLPWGNFKSSGQIKKMPSPTYRFVKEGDFPSSATFWGEVEGGRSNLTRIYRIFTIQPFQSLWKMPFKKLRFLPS